MIHRIAITAIAGVLALPAIALEISEYQLVDLSHSYNSDTVFWPTSPSRFEKDELSFGKTDGGWFYSAYTICTPEHGGTHLDAPQHFAANGFPTDRIPLENLIGKAVVIDVSKKAAVNRNYVLSVSDVISFENQYGRISTGDIVLLRTGWNRFWPDAKAYLGDDTPGDAGQLQFPSYGEDAARLLVEERGVAILGVDTASTDFGKSTNFIVHRIAAARNVSNLENLTFRAVAYWLEPILAGC